MTDEHDESWRLNVLPLPVSLTGALLAPAAPWLILLSATHTTGAGGVASLKFESIRRDKPKSATFARRETFAAVS